jgi:hypothetical protein
MSELLSVLFDPTRSHPIPPDPTRSHPIVGIPPILRIPLPIPHLLLSINKLAFSIDLRRLYVKF